MRKISLLIYCGIAALLLSNCTTIHSIPLAIPPQTNVILKENNYRMIKKVTGEWSASYILGLGGTSRETLANNSLAIMIENAQLKDNQAIISTTTAASTTYILYPFFTEITSVSTGYVIEFVDSNHTTASMTNPIHEDRINTHNAGKESSESYSVVNEERQTVPTSIIKTETRPLKNKLPDSISPTYESFRSARIYNMSKNEKSSTEKAFISEIETDLRNAKNIDDLDIINMKIGYLDQYSTINNGMKLSVKRLKESLNNKVQDLQ